MDWFAYLPPGMAIFFVLVSNLTGGYLHNLVDNFAKASIKDSVKEDKELFEYVAADWATRLSFFNTLFAAVVTVFAIYANPRAYGWAVGTTVLLLLIFIASWLWIMQHNIGELAETCFPGTRLTHARGCDLVVVVINGILMIAIYNNQRLLLSP